MDQEPFNDKERDAVTSDDVLECYRPGRDDTHDPQLAPLAARLKYDRKLSRRLDRIARLDSSIQSAFDDVSIPSGLAANIMARLVEPELPASESPKSETLRNAIAPVKVSMATVRMPGQSRPSRKQTGRLQFTRRRALFALAALAGIAATIFLGIFWALHRPRAVTPTSLLDEAITVFTLETADHPQGQLVTAVPPPAALRFSSDLWPLRGTRWRKVANFLDRQAIAYDLLPIQGGARATLYVLPCNGTVPGLRPFAPGMPTGSTGGCSAGAWQVGGTLYVLVVEGDNRAYGKYLDQSHGPIA